MCASSVAIALREQEEVHQLTSKIGSPIHVIPFLRLRSCMDFHFLWKYQSYRPIYFKTLASFFVITMMNVTFKVFSA